MLHDRISLRNNKEVLGMRFGSPRFKRPASYEENKRNSYFTGASSRNMMFDDEDNQTEVIGDVFSKKRRGSIFGQDLGNMFGN